MILIADSGSSKTDWRVIHKDGQISQFRGIGFNPYYLSVAEMTEQLKQDYRAAMIEQELAPEHKQIIKAADSIAAYLKCKMEVAAGNFEFSTAEKEIEAKLKAFDLPEVGYFLDTFSSSYELTLDELFRK